MFFQIVAISSFLTNMIIMSLKILCWPKVYLKTKNEYFTYTILLQVCNTKSKHQKKEEVLFGSFEYRKCTYKSLSESMKDNISNYLFLFVCAQWIQNTTSKVFHNKNHPKISNTLYIIMSHRHLFCQSSSQVCNK